MARIRTIKPEFWAHEGLSAMPEATHLLAGALLNHADDEGYFNANPALVKAACFPLREPTVSVEESMTLLAREGYLQIGIGCGRRYGRIVNFLAHQSINRPRPSKIKGLSITWGGSHMAHCAFSGQSMEEWNREQGMEEEGISWPAATTDEPDDSGPPAEANGNEPTAKTNGESDGESAEQRDQSYPPEFEDFWEVYPRRNGRKRGKSTAFGIWRKAIGKGQRQTLIRAARNYAGSTEVRDGYARDAERFLKGGWWLDWAEESDDEDRTGRPLTAEQMAKIRPEDVRG